MPRAALLISHCRTAGSLAYLALRGRLRNPATLQFSKVIEAAEPSPGYPPHRERSPNPWYHQVRATTPSRACHHSVSHLCPHRFARAGCPGSKPLVADGNIESHQSCFRTQQWRCGVCRSLRVHRHLGRSRWGYDSQRSFWPVANSPTALVESRPFKLPPGPQDLLLVGGQLHGDRAVNRFLESPHR